MTARLRRLLARLGLAMGLLLLWEAYVGVMDVPPTILPPPSRIASTAASSWDLLLWHGVQTLLQAAVGFGLAVFVASLIAALVDFSPAARRALLPLLVTSQTIPIVALAPLLVLWFGFGALPKVLVVALVCFFPMVVAAARGFDSADPELARLYRTFGASRWQVFRLVRLPTALPQFFSGMRVAVTYSVVGSIFGELAGASRGLGILMQTAKNAYRTDLVFGAIGATAALSLVLFGLVALIERLVIPWARASQPDGSPA